MTMRFLCALGISFFTGLSNGAAVAADTVSRKGIDVEALEFINTQTAKNSYEGGVFRQMARQKISVSGNTLSVLDRDGKPIDRVDLHKLDARAIVKTLQDRIVTAAKLEDCDRYSSIQDWHVCRDRNKKKSSAVTLVNVYFVKMCSPTESVEDIVGKKQVGCLAFPFADEDIANRVSKAAVELIKSGGGATSRF